MQFQHAFPSTKPDLDIGLASNQKLLLSAEFEKTFFFAPISDTIL